MWNEYAESWRRFGPAGMSVTLIHRLNRTRYLRQNEMEGIIIVISAFDERR